jgi:hypothetical protein
MAGKSPVTACDEQSAGLLALADSRDRGEADRARAVLLTLAGWTSPKITEAFGVREDTVRLCRSDFTAGGVAALKTRIAPGPPPVKSEAALRVAAPLMEEPVVGRRNWTIPRLRADLPSSTGRVERVSHEKGVINVSAECTDTISYTTQNGANQSQVSRRDRLQSGRRSLPRYDHDQVPPLAAGGSSAGRGAAENQTDRARRFRA